MCLLFSLRFLISSMGLASKVVPPWRVISVYNNNCGACLFFSFFVALVGDDFSFKVYKRGLLNTLQLSLRHCLTDFFPFLFCFGCFEIFSPSLRCSNEMVNLHQLACLRTVKLKRNLWQNGRYIRQCRRDATRIATGDSVTLLRLRQAKIERPLFWMQ